MDRSIGGVSLAAQCSEAFLASLERPEVETLALPPGADVLDAIETLRARDVTLDMLPEISIDPGEDAAGELIRLLGFMFDMGERGSATPDAWVLDHVEDLAYPRRIAVPLAPDMGAKGIDAIRKACSTLARASKDLEGPLGFLLVAPYPASEAVANAAHIWQPALAVPHALDLGDSPVPLIERGFRTYVGLRAYWEGSGQLAAVDSLETFQERWPAAPPHGADTDARLDAWFDTSMADHAPEPARCEAAVRTHLTDSQVRIAVQTGRLPALPAPAARALLAAGLVWRPPGSLSVHITSQAAAALCRSPAWRANFIAGDDVERRFRARARANPLLSSWALLLTSQIERAMFDHCRTHGNVRMVLQLDGMGKTLAHAVRTAPKDLAYIQETDELDHASFGELRILMRKAGIEARFPLTPRRLDQVRLTRNLAAHLQTPSWNGIRNLLEALDGLASRRPS